MNSEKTANCLELEEQPPVLLSLQKRKWTYRGEGNANLVIALPEEGLILRLHKWERDREVTVQSELEEEQRGWRETVFCRMVMVPLLGSAYIQPPVRAQIDRNELAYLDQALIPYRPAYRVHKGIKFGYVTIYPDYALLPLHLKNVANDMDNMNFLNDAKVNRNQRVNDASGTSNSVTQQPSVCRVGRNGTKRILQLCKVSIENRQAIVPTPVTTGENTTAERNSCNENRSPLGKTLDNFPALLSNCNQNCSVGRLKANERKTSVFCVEIKPKQGWIPFIDRGNPQCTFCLTQYLKLSKGTVDGLSRYCPLDLFSGIEGRMKKALKALLCTPQNNFKIFQDGALVYSDEVKSELMAILKEWFESSSNDVTLDDFDRLIDKFCNLVYQALTIDLTEGEVLPEIEDLPHPDPFGINDGNVMPSSPLIASATPFLGFSQSCDWSSQALPTNCILDRILNIQQLQQFGVDVVYQLYRNLNAEEGDFSYVSRLCGEATPEKLKLDPVQRYLLATTAKDCSILISFQQVTNPEINCEEHKMRDVDGVGYIWNIGVSDLDPKPLSCIEKHRKRDRDVISACADFLKNS